MTSILFSAEKEEIVILFENDVHRNVDSYAKLAAMKQELSAAYDYVGVVSSGDFAQGGNLGVVSNGEYIVNIMNLVVYDAIMLGNHEFDYKIERLFFALQIMWQHLKRVRNKYYLMVMK